MSADGKNLGTITLTQIRSGVRLNLALPGLRAGEHSPEGRHAGDMWYLNIPKSGKLTLTMTNSDVTLETGKPGSLFQEGGTAIVIHANKDDYLTDPAGNAGDRIACGVITEQAPRVATQRGISTQ